MVENETVPFKAPMVLFDDHFFLTHSHSEVGDEENRFFAGLIPDVNCSLPDVLSADSSRGWHRMRNLG